MYAVVEINQASRQPSEVYGPHGSLRDALDEAEALRATTLDIGRRERFLVCELVEVDK